MSTDHERSSSGRPRQIDVDATQFLEDPMDLLRGRALARGKPGSASCTLMARMFRLVAYGLMFGDSGKGRGSGHLPPGFTVRQAAQRATDLIDLADELDGLGRP